MHISKAAANFAELGSHTHPSPYCISVVIVDHIFLAVPVTLTAIHDDETVFMVFYSVS